MLPTLRQTFLWRFLELFSLFYRFHLNLINKMASEAVLKYLTDTNRPYSCADVTVNLRGAYPKSGIQKALDALSEAGKIKCKLYGKQKVFAALQPDIVESSDNDIKDYDKLFKSLTEELAEKANGLKAAETKLKCLTATPKTDAAKVQTEDIVKRMEVLQAKLDVLKTSTEVVSAEDKKIILNGHEKLLKEYRKRKRISSDMLEAVMEGYPKSKKTLIEELCIETDEMANFKLTST